MRLDGTLLVELSRKLKETEIFVQCKEIFAACLILKSQYVLYNLAPAFIVKTEPNKIKLLSLFWRERDGAISREYIFSWLMLPKIVDLVAQGWRHFLSV